MTNLKKNWTTDVYNIARMWIPLDFVCFAVPLYIRLPIRHVFSLLWTIFFSWYRGANKTKIEKQ